MKIIKGMIAICAAMSMLPVSAHAADTCDASFKAEIKDGMVSVTKDELLSNMNNSNLLVKLLKQTGDESTENIIQSISNVENITYDIIYAVENGYMNIEYNMTNVSAKEQIVTMIAALYEENLFQRLITETLSLQTQEKKQWYLALKLPETDLYKYNVKMMVWDSFTGFRPLGNAKTVNGIRGDLNEKTIVISSSANNEIKVFMNSESLVKNDNAEHCIKYNPQKLELTDLCGFTYEKETVSGEIANTGITVKSVDLTTGEIIYTFNMPEGKTTGINNFIKFKSLTDLSGERITYTIQ